MSNRPKEHGIKHNDGFTDDTDREAARHPNKSANYRAEAQNVNDEDAPPMSDEEAQHGVNKANQGQDDE